MPSNRQVYARSIGALAVVAAVSLVVVTTAVVVGGVVAWVLSLVAGFLLGLLLTPVTSQWVLLRALTARPLVTIAVLGVLTLPVLYVGPVRREIRDFREELGCAGVPAAESYPEVARSVERLAQQADVPAPGVYVARRDRAESYAVGGGTVVVTTGLVRALSAAELEAVLAHEVSHLANGDSRLMGAALVPLLVTERMGSSGPPEMSWFVRQPLAGAFRTGFWAVLTLVSYVQGIANQFGLAVLSRERELAADRGAARLTGDPAALASALERLSDDRRRPDEDARSWHRAASVLDILPSEGPAMADNPFRTHPPTDERIEHLRAIEREQATG
jgi:heat shock protein HtpX